MKEKKWWFVSNLNATDDGLNDAGIETFSADAQKSNIREVIQNSIDQISNKALQNKLPVIVEFDDFVIGPDLFPNRIQFKNIIEKCIESSNDEIDVKRFFQQANLMIENPIKVLRISDYNTTGLVGAESGEKGKPWYSLIKSKGSSNKNMNSGGSFGIGKSAPFACSSFRTVFYSSKVDSIESYIGVARLISFDINNERTIGTGYYSDSLELKAILENFQMNEYHRKENGTDIYIMGYDGSEDFKKVLIETTLSNFFISIYKGLLIVKYKNFEINKQNLGQYIATLNNDEFDYLKAYYELLCSKPFPDDTNIKFISLDSNEYGKKLGFMDRECKLLLMRGEDLNRRILMTRQAGMSLFLQDRISGNISFTGILLIEGDNMNEVFKAMEMPAHDAWEPQRCKIDTQKYKDAYSELRIYLRKKVIECFGQTQEDAISAYGMEEFFSDLDEKQGEAKIADLNGKTSVEVSKSAISKRSKNRVIDIDGEDGLDFDPDKKHQKKNTPIPNPGKKKGKGYKYVNLKKRLLCRNENNGEYSLKFTVENEIESIKLEFIGLAEKGSYKLNLNNVVLQGDGEISNLQNIIIIDNCKRKGAFEIDFQIDFDKKCMMEVNYYEFK